MPTKDVKKLTNKKTVKSKKGIDQETGKLMKGFKYIKGGDIVRTEQRGAKSALTYSLFGPRKKKKQTPVAPTPVAPAPTPAATAAPATTPAAPLAPASTAAPPAATAAPVSTATAPTPPAPAATAAPVSTATATASTATAPPPASPEITKNKVKEIFSPKNIFEMDKNIIQYRVTDDEKYTINIIYNDEDISKIVINEDIISDAYFCILSDFLKYLQKTNRIKETTSVYKMLNTQTPNHEKHKFFFKNKLGFIFVTEIMEIKQMKELYKDVLHSIYLKTLMSELLSKLCTVGGNYGKKKKQMTSKRKSTTDKVTVKPKSKDNNVVKSNKSTNKKDKK